MPSSTNKCLPLSQLDRQSDFSHIGAWSTEAAPSAATVSNLASRKTPQNQSDETLSLPPPNRLEIKLRLSSDLFQLQQQAHHATTSQRKAIEAPDAVDIDIESWIAIHFEESGTEMKTLVTPERYPILLAPGYRDFPIHTDGSFLTSHHKCTHKECHVSDNWSLCVSSNTSQPTQDCNESPDDFSTHPDGNSTVLLAESNIPVRQNPELSYEQGITAVDDIQTQQVHQDCLPTKQCLSKSA
jgi:hypothetical protein